MPLLPVADHAAHVFGIEDLPQDVAVLRPARAQQAEDPHRRVVRQQHVPVPVRDDRRVGLLMLENELDRAAHRRHLRRRQLGLAIARREAGRDQQRIALAQRHAQRIGQSRDHVAARLRLAGFHAAQVPRRNVRFERELELAQAARSSPFAQQGADVRGGAAGGARVSMACTGRMIRRRVGKFHDLRGHCRHVRGPRINVAMAGVVPRTEN